MTCRARAATKRRGCGGTGFTPTSGVPMSTRSGDLDPGLVWYLARTEKMSAKQFNEMVNSQSGLRDLLGE